jgi:hypothetical protein
LTPALNEERLKRLGDMTRDGLMEDAPAAMQAFGKLLKDLKTAASVKADLIKFLYEQLHGKAKAKIDLDAKVGPRDVLAAAIVLDDGLPQDTPNAIEGVAHTERGADAPFVADPMDDDRSPRYLDDEDL